MKKLTYEFLNYLPCTYAESEWTRYINGESQEKKEKVVKTLAEKLTTPEYRNSEVKQGIARDLWNLVVVQYPGYCYSHQVDKLFAQEQAEQVITQAMKLKLIKLILDGQAEMPCLEPDKVKELREKAELLKNNIQQYIANPTLRERERREHEPLEKMVVGVFLVLAMLVGLVMLLGAYRHYRQVERRLQEWNWSDQANSVILLLMGLLTFSFGFMFLVMPHVIVNWTAPFFKKFFPSDLPVEEKGNSQEHQDRFNKFFSEARDIKQTSEMNIGSSSDGNPSWGLSSRLRIASGSRAENADEIDVEDQVMEEIKKTM